MESNNSIRPHNVNIAIALLWTSLVVGVIGFVVNVKLLYIIAMGGYATIVAAIVYFICINAAMAVLIVLISKGKNWARMTMLVFYIYGLLRYAMTFSGEHSSLTLLGLLAVAQALLQLIAYYFLFTKPGSVWFKKQRT